MLLISPPRWWLLLLESTLFVLFGIFSMVHSSMSTSTETFLFAGLSVSIAFLACIAAFRERRKLVEWWLNLIIAACNASIGIFALVYPLANSGYMEPAFLSVLMGIQGLIQGGIGIGMSLDMQHEIKVRGLFMIFAIFSITAGILILANPYTQTFAQHTLVWVYGLVCGISLIPGALRLKLYA